MRSRISVGLIALVAFIYSAAYAQTPGDATTESRADLADALCNVAEAPITTSSPTLVDARGGQVQRKSWQALGGEVGFALRMSKSIPPDAQVLVCFRWSPLDDRSAPYRATRPDRLDLTLDGKTLEVFATIPRSLRHAWPGSGEVRRTGMDLVPLADVRILVLAPDAAGRRSTILADNHSSLGITTALWGAGFATTVLILGVLMLVLAAHWRLGHRGLATAGPLLGIITTRDGRASLARLQLVLWTLLVATSAVYVMALSGELIQITDGTLALLGISGAVAVGAETSRKLQVAPHPAPRRARWSDLVLNEDPAQNRIDTARMQILCFTLIGVTFVALRVATTFVIPEIPAGFQILLGLSSAIYLGSKAARPARPSES